MDRIGQEFMEKTHFENLEPSDQMAGIPHPPLQRAYDGSGEVIDLPDPGEISVSALDIREAIERRRSIRQYAAEPVSMEELAYLLWCTQGVKENVQGQFTFRTVPSAGARHAFETFLLINNVQGLRRGVYRYLALSHQLAEINRDPDIAGRITGACLHQQFVRNNAATFIWVADAYRMTWRYGQRGYRYLHIDAGHVCQNLYLAAQTVGCGVCAVGAFHDQVLNAELGLDGVGQFVVYLASMGKI